MATKNKCRQYSVDYLKFGFIESPSKSQLPLCLLCEKLFSSEAMKPSRLKVHLTTMHSDKACKSVSYFQSLSSSFSKRKAFFKPMPKTFTVRPRYLLHTQDVKCEQS